MYIKTVFVITFFVLSPLLAHGAENGYPPNVPLNFAISEFIQVKLHSLHNRLLNQPSQKAQNRARSLGFDSLDQLKNAEPDIRNRLPVFYVGLSDLRTYVAGIDPWLLLERTDSFIYPIVSAKKENHNVILSGVMVHVDESAKGKENPYRFSQLGISLSIPNRVLNSAKEELLGKLGNCDYFVISIPALNKRLLGFRREGTCPFRVIDTDPYHRTKTILSQPAKDVFQALASEAKTNRYEMPVEDENYPELEQ